MKSGFFGLFLQVTSVTSSCSFFPGKPRQNEMRNWNSGLFFVIVCAPCSVETRLRAESGCWSALAMLRQALQQCRMLIFSSRKHARARALARSSRRRRRKRKGREGREGLGWARTLRVFFSGPHPARKLLEVQLGCREQFFCSWLRATGAD